MTAGVPPWIRAIIAIDRAATGFSVLAQSLLRELPCLLVAPAKRDDLTAAIYARQSRYVADEPTAHELFDWEVEAVQTPPFPPAGRLLVGGVGGGREVAGFLDRGYSVVAFEPSDLVEHARALANPPSRVVRASYRDLMRAAQGGGGPLAEIADARFDAVVLGWGSLAHVIDDDERRELFRSLRTVAPGAPVLCSFLVSSEPTTAFVARLRRRLRRGRIDPNLRFVPHAGFISLLAREDVEGLASDAGYVVVRYAEVPYPHALLAAR